MTTLNEQQIANNLQAAENERKHIAMLEQALAEATDATSKQVLRERIKLCKKFLRDYLLRVEAGKRYAN